MTATVRRPYGELDRTQVVDALHTLARRVGVQKVTMRELAAELGAAAPSVYYHVPGKREALDLLAETVLSSIEEPGPGAWDTRLAQLYCNARITMLEVPGIAGVLQTNGDGQRARRLDKLSRALIAEGGLSGSAASAAHSVLYTYLLGAVSLEESRSHPNKSRTTAQYRAGLYIVIAGIRTKAARA